MGMRIAKVFFLAALGSIGILGSAMHAAAETISYTTAGLFTGTGASGNVVTMGSDTITFNGITVSNLGLNPPALTFASLGDFVSAGSSSQNFSDSFQLTITQTLPGSGTGTLLGTLNGLLTINSSGAAVLFSTPSADIVTASPISNTLYSLVTLLTPIVPPSTNGGVSTVEAGISGTLGAPTPLPASFAGGTALLALVGLIKLRKMAQRPPVL